MDVKTGFFFLFAAVLLISALRVVTARNPVHAVLFLMLAFSQASAIWLLLQAEFLAVALVLVYLGAVMVLFLFVVMMLDIRIDRLRQGFWKHLPLALLLGGIVVVEMAAVLLTGFDMVEPQAAAELAGDAGEVSNAKALGILLYTRYVWPIQIAAVILLVAMIAAIALTLRARKDSKAIDPSIQVRVRAQDRLQLVKMDPTRPAEPVAEDDAEEKKA
jgi:NADH-quinone oxidoreductase subunit J